MPVYLITAHAYCSWSESNPRGYVQRDEGLKPSSKPLAAWRQSRAKQPPARFDEQQQHLLSDVLDAVAEEYHFRLHACCTTPTHIHAIVSFQSPACPCGAAGGATMC